jgi:hypothetical protein
MDAHLLYKLLGYNSVGVDKTLTQFAVNDYISFANDLSTKLAKACIALLLQSYNVNESYSIYSTIKINNVLVNVSLLNHGNMCMSSNFKLSYKLLDKYMNFSCTTTKEYIFATYTTQIKDYFINILKDMIMEIFNKKLFNHDTELCMWFICEDVCMKEELSKDILMEYQFSLEELNVKETPSKSLYNFKFSAYK